MGKLVKELQTKSPLLLKILTAVVVRMDSRYAPKSQIVHHPAIVTAIAVLLKERNREMSGVQSINSCLIYACHCEKQVCILGLPKITISCCNLFTFFQFNSSISFQLMF